MPIYLDYNATTPMDEAVITAMSDCARQLTGNPSSLHQLGRQAKQRLDDAAESIAESLGAQTNQADSDRFIVTSGGTEANNLALRGLPDRSPGRIVVSAIEHPSVWSAAEIMEQSGWQVDSLRVTEGGVIDLHHLDELLAQQPLPRLVAVMLSNNETGVIQPVADVVRRCEPLGVEVHTDAVQSVGKAPVNFRQLGVTTLAIAAHKFHGPCGVGGLLVRGKTRRHPILYGGSQQLGTRPGTEAVGLVVGMQVALRQWMESGEARRRHLAACQRQLEARLLEGVPDLAINGQQPRLPQTVNLSFPDVDRQSLLMALDLAGVCCSTGSACASGSSEPSHVLQAMGLPDWRVNGAIRLSVGVPTSLADVDLATQRILRCLQQLRR